MRVTIHDAGMDLVASGRVERSRVHFDKKGKLSPRGQYTIRLYREGDEPVRAWKPEDRPDLLVLERTDDRAELFEPAPPPGTSGLAYRVRFEVDNDGALPKLIRWRFQSEKAEDATSWRIALVVQPSARRQVALVGSFAIALLLTELYEAFARCELNWEMTRRATLGALAVAVAGVLLWSLIGLVWTPRE